ncbi:hypothetical protein DPMN_115725 [Dreissena polymorpha]|uniref:Uncharacterized protein n=1 Tax=Dreissena polymorpha TaxID=45954 RepID=A0A9D4KMH3_DREPO|nr:hypothetical protein DPMN_115725 [Dreissena polymorpha]
MKKAKRNLRKAQRKFHAKKRCSDLENIMNATDDTTFYKLVRKQRSTSRHLTNCLLNEGRKLTSPEEISDGWGKHFETLATPINDQRYDHFYLKQATKDLNHLQIAFQTSGKTVAETDVPEVECAVAKLNNNKAADYMGLTAEHLKYGGAAIYLPCAGEDNQQNV